MSESPEEQPPFGAEVAARAAALEARIAELEASTREVVIRAELKAEAVKAGMVDLDGLKLADTSTVTLNDAGEVVGAAALMAGLRRAKPWLFGAASSSSVAAVPAAAGVRSKSATEMSYEEWQAGRKELVRRR
jgi:hypothetical protein